MVGELNFRIYGIFSVKLPRGLLILSHQQGGGHNRGRALN